VTWKDFWPLDTTFTTGHGWWLDPLRASVGQGAEYWPPRAIRDLICPLRWLSLVNLTFLYLLCHTELFLLTMNYKTVRIYSLLPSERRRFPFILNLIGTVIVRVRHLLGLLLTKSMNCSSFKAISHPDRNVPSSGKRKVHFGGKKSQALDIIRSQKYPFVSSNAISLKHKIWQSADCSSSRCSFSNRVFVLPFNPLNAELNPICYLLALLGAHHFLHVSRIRVKSLTLRLLMSYIYGAPILDVSRLHTTTQHSR